MQSAEAYVQWDQCYREGRIPWDRSGVSAGFTLFLSVGAFPKAGRVLVPGCGNGYEVEALAYEGYEVTAVDMALTPLVSLRKRLREQGLSAEVIQADFFQWRPLHPFDAIFEQTSLCALPPDQWPGYVDRLYEWLRPGGRLLILFMQTHREEGPPWHCDISVMHRLFPEERWEWRHTWPKQPTHAPPLVEIPWMLIRRPQSREQ